MYSPVQSVPKVEMRLGEEGPWTAMKQVKEKDPYLLAINKLQESPNPPTGNKLVPMQRKPTHLWKAFLPRAELKRELS